MTEEEWLACADAFTLLYPLRGKLSERKVRLFDCACCRRIWHLLNDARSRHAVDIAEQYADGVVDSAALANAAKLAWSARCLLGRVSSMGLQTYWVKAAEAAHGTCHDFKSHPRHGGAYPVAARDALNTINMQHFGMASDLAWKFNTPDSPEETSAQCGLARDIFGNPFRPVVFDHTWRTDTAVALARQMYESREFGAMPILADALQDAGCDNTDVLNHCREANAAHVRGCWVVDLVLGKE